MSRSQEKTKTTQGRLTSPSHLFFPFLQAVQALAPRFGMCDDGCEEDAGRGCGDPSAKIWLTCWFIPLALVMLAVRRRFAGTSGEFEAIVVEDENVLMSPVGAAVTRRVCTMSSSFLGVGCPY